MPQDPIALVIDLAGQLNLTADLLDFTTLAERGEIDGLIVPVSANLKALLVSAVGAELTGTGDFTFNADDYETFAGIPRPEGMADLKLTGIDTLLDRLVAMGLLPEDQALGARLALGLFGDPVEGEDAFTSKIEINGEGHLLANGQRLR